MAHRVRITSGAARELKKLPRELRTALFESIVSLSAEPYPPRVEKVAEVKHGYRIRVGDYRIAYVVIDDGTILVAKVGHRSEVYRHIVDTLNKAASKHRRLSE